MLDWRSGGGLLALALLLVLAAVGWRVTKMLESPARTTGHGFDLESPLVPADLIVPSGVPQDGIPALTAPPVMAGADVAAFNAAQRGKYLVSSDRVVGVVIDGQARAYPIRVLNWHEIVNDTVGGIPLAVTFSPLCDSVVVLDRRSEGEILEFGVSGLLFNSNLLLYDRRSDPADRSLWSQLQGRAVAGPAAGRKLRVLPASLARWSHWLARFPETTVLDPDPARLAHYRRNPYGSYLMTGKLRYPVDPLPSEGSLSPMSPVLTRTGGDGRVLRFDAPSLRGLAAESKKHGESVDLDLRDEPPSIIFGSDATEGVVYARWFAWFSQYPENSALDVKNGHF